MATDLNTIVIIGNLTRDAELKYLQTGTAISNFSIAVNKSKKNQDGTWDNYTAFFDVTLFGKSAENLKQYLVKGQKVCVKGELRQDRWEKDGQKYSKVYIGAETIQLLGGRDSGGQSGQNTSYNPQKQPQNESNLDFQGVIPF